MYSLGSCAPVKSGDITMIDYTLFVGPTGFDIFVGRHPKEYDAPACDPNLHGLCCGNYEATACGMSVNTCPKNKSVKGKSGGPMHDRSDEKDMMTHEVVTNHCKYGTGLAAPVGKDHGTGLLCDRVVKGAKSSGAKVATVESPE